MRARLLHAEHPDLLSRPAVQERLRSVPCRLLVLTTWANSIERVASSWRVERSGSELSRALSEPDSSFRHE